MVTGTLAYAFKSGEYIHAAVKRIAAEELDSAIDQLEGRGETDRDEAIHEARKNVKKVRGVLRLMRPELGAIYVRENQRLRDAGRKISEFRDAGAMLEIFDQLGKHYCAEWGVRPGLASIRAKLVEAKAGHESEAGIADVLASVSRELRAVREDVKDWPLHADGFAAIAPGLRLTYRNGRRAMALALQEPSPENYHNWRKRVKDHWYQVRLIGRICGDALAFYRQTLKDLEVCLGDDHNLTVLKRKISLEPAAYGAEPDVAFLLFSVENYQSSLRARALLLGQDVYDDKPRVFVRQLRSLWHAWVHHRAAGSASFAAAAS